MFSTGCIFHINECPFSTFWCDWENVCLWSQKMLKPQITTVKTLKWFLPACNNKPQKRRTAGTNPVNWILLFFCKLYFCLLTGRHFTTSIISRILMSSFTFYLLPITFHLLVLFLEERSHDKASHSEVRCQEDW